MKFAEILRIEDAYSAMCELSILLAEKAATQAQLSPAEQAIHDIMWVDIQVNANGFDGWLYNTPSERIAHTVHALSLVGCSRLSEIVAGALVTVRLNPQVARDRARQSLLDSLSDEQRERLFALDSEYYDAAESCMAKCREFVISRRVEFSVDETMA